HNPHPFPTRRSSDLLVVGLEDVAEGAPAQFLDHVVALQPAERTPRRRRVGEPDVTGVAVRAGKGGGLGLRQRALLEALQQGFPEIGRAACRERWERW